MSARLGTGPLGIVSALPQELAELLTLLEPGGDMAGSTGGTVEAAGRRLQRGRLHGHDVVLTLCGIGKVAAALTTTLLIERLGVRGLIFTGVAGGLGSGVRVGDVVVARTLLQHDMDASPLFPRHQVPDLGVDQMASDETLSSALLAAAQTVLQRPPAEVAAFGLDAASVHEGLVISGDRFVSTLAESMALRTRLPQALAVEMEGAAMAQVCAAYGVPFAVLRSISDRADDHAHVDFPRFLAEVASPLSREIVGLAVQHL